MRRALCRVRANVPFAIALWEAISRSRIRGVGRVGICFMGHVCLSGLGRVGVVVVRFVGIRLITDRRLLVVVLFGARWKLFLVLVVGSRRSFGLCAAES